MKLRGRVVELRFCVVQLLFGVKQLFSARVELGRAAVILAPAIVQFPLVCGDAARADALQLGKLLGKLRFFRLRLGNTGLELLLCALQLRKLRLIRREFLFRHSLSGRLLKR